MSASTRWLAILAAVIAVAVFAGILVTMGAGGADTYPEGSPERAVQDYLRAVGDREATTALSFISPELAARCSTTSREPIASRGSSGLRATLDRATTRGETAEVHVLITETYGSGPFGANESNQTAVFILARTDGQWRFTEPPWPLHCPPVAVPAK
ncbi:MAG: hypothetical protein FJ037_04580 [Chloroflexi bacterium]|nr:hypothetical protein [Chloroflexota bacterium]